MENNEKKKWEKPEIKSLEINKTQSGYFTGVEEGDFYVAS